MCVRPPPPLQLAWALAGSSSRKRKNGVKLLERGGGGREGGRERAGASDLAFFNFGSY